ncbi:MAG: thiamine diphosphokinase [Ruminococcaceae bacterium]|nr:thiamine diphosphokinase [Oscillospiraceae bacterium]
MRAFIYTGGKVFVENITEHPRGGDIKIAADAGYNTAKLLGVTPDILVGDFDSLGDIPEEKGMKVHQVPAEKDLTDTQIAVELAIGSGANEIFIIGGLSGRLDHTLSTLSILEDLRGRAVHGYVTDGQSRARYICSTSTLIARSQYKYLSIIAADEVAKGVSVEGCKYPLKKATINRRLQYAVSNEITGNVALISVRKGGIYIIESKDIR